MTQPRGILDSVARPAGARSVSSRAPLRLGLAGGGTDLSPYCDTFGGEVLNATISLHASARVTARADGKVGFRGLDVRAADEFSAGALLHSQDLPLHAACHARFLRQFRGGEPLAVDVVSTCDAPPGTGLGSSSAMVVALVAAYAAYLGLPLDRHAIARLAFEIERIDLGMAGGRQDQYAAAHGGLNAIEFLPGERVTVTPVTLDAAHRAALEEALVLCHTGRSRVSSVIIEQQTAGLRRADDRSMTAMHQLKQDARDMRACLVAGDLRAAADVLARSWEAKKRTASGISNAHIEQIYGAAIAAGAWSGKISGAGGGGCIMFMVPPERRAAVEAALVAEGAELLPFHFTFAGCETWVDTP